MKLERIQIAFASVSLVVLVALISSCNGLPGSVDPIGDDPYTVEAYQVRDMDRDTAFTRVKFLQNNQPVPSGPVDVDTSRLTFVQLSGLFEEDFASASDIDTGSHALKLQDGGNTILNSNFTMTGDFTIRVSLPADRLYTGAGIVTVLSSTISSNSNGYIFAAVKAGEEYTGSGWAGLSLSGTQSGTFPPSVFQDTANNLDTGLYYIYMYSFRDSPRINSINDDLPTVLPDSVFLDNLTTDLISGSFGTITVSRHDSIFVQQL